MKVQGEERKKNRQSKELNVGGMACEPGFKKQRQEDCKFETSLGYKGRPCLKKIKKSRLTTGYLKEQEPGGCCGLRTGYRGTMGVIHILAKRVCVSEPVPHGRTYAFFQLTRLPSHPGGDGGLFKS